MHPVSWLILSSADPRFKRRANDELRNHKGYPYGAAAHDEHSLGAAPYNVIRIIAATATNMPNHWRPFIGSDRTKRASSTVTAG